MKRQRANDEPTTATTKRPKMSTHHRRRTWSKQQLKELALPIFLRTNAKQLTPSMITKRGIRTNEYCLTLTANDQAAVHAIGEKMYDTKFVRRVLEYSVHRGYNPEACIWHPILHPPMLVLSLLKEYGHDHPHLLNACRAIVTWVDNTYPSTFRLNQMRHELAILVLNVLACSRSKECILYTR